MAEKEITEARSLERGKIPDSLREILEELPTPQAVRVIEDIGRAGLFGHRNNNNNNNNCRAVLQERIMENVAKLPADKLRQLL